MSTSDTNGNDSTGFDSTSTPEAVETNIAADLFDPRASAATVGETRVRNPSMRIRVDRTRQGATTCTTGRSTLCSGRMRVTVDRVLRGIAKLLPHRAAPASMARNSRKLRPLDQGLPNAPCV